MQYAAYAHPYVRNVSMTGDQLTLEVEVTNFKGTEGAVEITGVVTQGGAVANISAFKDIADAKPGEDDDDKDELFVTVTADILSQDTFEPDPDVTIFIQVSKVWVTVLGSKIGQQSDGAPAAWGGVPKAVTQIGDKT